MVLFLSSFSDARTVMAAVEAGADGYLLKEIGGPDIAMAIRNALAGVTTYSPKVGSIVRRGHLGSHPSPDGQLSNQERRIMECVARGMMNKEIGGQLGLAEGTVRNYLSGIFEKLGVQSRAEAAVRFVRDNGLD
jgi:DNA-binding NarL/FixJ family response regulator